MNFILTTIIVLCFVCLMQRCNAIICYHCNSLDLADCAMSLDASELPYEDCKMELRCIMSIVDSVTYRGCGMSTPTTGAKYVKDCFTNLCNKGVFPPGRLKCHHCTGTDCIAKPQGKPRPCLMHHEDDACYTEILSANQVNRGCRSDADHTEIDANVIYCDVNGCNDEAAVSTLKCAKCDSKVDLGCKMDLSTINDPKCNITQYDVCEVDAWLSQNETCFVYHRLDRVVRGCKRDIPEDIATDLERLTECNHSDLCNRKCMEQQRCVICDSTKNADCRANTTDLAKHTCGSAETSSCYACEFNNWEVSRDCGPLPKDPVNVNRFYECDVTVGCNAMLLTRCYNCSSRQNANCANWERPGPSVEVEECEEPDAHCIKAAFPDGLIVRGCHSSTLSCNDSMTNCESCYGNFCNTGAYPAQRLRCYQCVGESECESIDDDDPLPCPESILDPTDSREACFEFYDADIGGIVRGCRSNAALYYKCIFQSGLNCHVCHNDGCNGSPAKTAPKLSCYQCDRETSSCQEQQTDSSLLKPCLKPVPFGYAESCFITRHIDGSTSRGCTLDFTSSLKSDWDQSNYCYTSGCNAPATTIQKEKNLKLYNNKSDNLN